MDYLLLGRALPSLMSWACLAGMVLSCLGYALADSTFSVQAYTWMGVWYLFSTFDACWFKTVCNTVHLSNWNRVFW
jgi:hypothetical protein